MQEAKWKELVAKYEEAKAKKDDFAIPPDDSQLLKFAPKKVWQKGEEKWHVDAPVNLAGDKLLVPTSFLDKEKVGERALYALNAATGETVWKRELTYNPWGGATVAGDLAIVPGSSIGYYYKELKGAKGDVTALDLKTGEVKWRKEIPTGGVLGLRCGRAMASRSAPRPTARCGRSRSPTANAPGSTTRRCRSSRRPPWPGAWSTSPTSAAPSTPSTSRPATRSGR